MAALNDNYTKGCERVDRTLFSKWNEKTGSFSKTGDTGVGGAYDVSGVTKDGRTCMIELKLRGCTHDKYDSDMIEADKMADGWMYERFSGLTPLYICFYADGWTGIYNLSTIHAPKKEKTRRVNPGMGGKVVESAVYYLSKDDGVFYDDGGRLHKGGV